MRAALAQTTVAFRNGRWVRTRRLTAREKRSGVVEVDETAAVQLAAVRALLGAPPARSTPRAEVAQALLMGASLPGICGFANMDGDSALAQLAIILARI